MDPEVKDKERTIEKLRLDNEEEDQKLLLAQKKALEADAKAKYGTGWKKILGIMKGLRPNMETVHDLYGADLGDLKEAGKLPAMRGSRSRYR